MKYKAIEHAIILKNHPYILHLCLELSDWTRSLVKSDFVCIISS